MPLFFFLVAPWLLLVAHQWVGPRTLGDADSYWWSVLAGGTVMVLALAYAAGLPSRSRLDVRHVAGAQGIQPSPWVGAVVGLVGTGAWLLCLHSLNAGWLLKVIMPAVFVWLLVSTVRTSPHSPKAFAAGIGMAFAVWLAVVVTAVVRMPQRWRTFAGLPGGELQPDTVHTQYMRVLDGLPALAMVGPAQGGASATPSGYGLELFDLMQRLGWLAGAMMAVVLLVMLALWGRWLQRQRANTQQPALLRIATALWLLVSVSVVLNLLLNVGVLRHAFGVGLPLPGLHPAWWPVWIAAVATSVGLWRATRPLAHADRDAQTGSATLG